MYLSVESICINFNKNSLNIWGQVEERCTCNRVRNSCIACVAVGPTYRERHFSITYNWNIFKNVKLYLTKIFSKNRNVSCSLACFVKKFTMFSEENYSISIMLCGFLLLTTSKKQMIPLFTYASFCSLRLPFQQHKLCFTKYISVLICMFFHKPQIYYKCLKLIALHNV